MCGIFLHLSEGDLDIENVKVVKNEHRGPDSTVEKVITSSNKTIYFQFHRLAINGLTESGNQPMEIGNKVLMCNGEIYNYKELAEKIII